LRAPTRRFRQKGKAAVCPSYGLIPPEPRTPSRTENLTLHSPWHTPFITMLSRRFRCQQHMSLRSCPSLRIASASTASKRSARLQGLTFQSQNYSEKPSRIDLLAVTVTDRLPLAATSCRWYTSSSSASLDPNVNVTDYEKPIYRAARGGNPELAESLFLELSK
jgi:hypothetical protein